MQSKGIKILVHNGHLNLSDTYIMGWTAKAMGDSSEEVFASQRVVSRDRGSKK